MGFGEPIAAGWSGTFRHLLSPAAARLSCPHHGPIISPNSWSVSVRSPFDRSPSMSIRTRLGKNGAAGLVGVSDL